jgi:hypothetical protein
MHCLSCVESSRLKKFIHGCSASTPLKIVACSLARVHASLDLVINGSEMGRMLNISDPMACDVTKHKIAKTRVRCAEEFWRIC